MVTVNDIPSEAIILETTTALIISFVSLVVLRKYRSRPRESTLYLFLTVLGYSLAVWTSNIGKILDFTSDVPQEELSYSGFSINIAYCFVALANIFLYALIETIFFTNNKDRKIAAAAVFGILIGIILDLNSFDQEAYSQLFSYILVFIAVSNLLYILVIILGIREIRRNEAKKVKVGFTLITLFGLFLMGIFIFFAIDILKIQATGNSYNLEYYLAWISGALASIFAYAGFTMPDWVQKLFGVYES